MSTFELVVGIATILGGLAALWFFWDKIVERWNHRHELPVKPEVIEKWVDINYPSDTGLQDKLKAVGYRVAWCSDKKLSRKTDLEGWEIVIEPDANGIHTKFRLEDPANQTL